MTRKPLDPAKMAQYMSAETANAIFGAKLSDDPAYVGNPRYGHTHQERFGPTYDEARDALQRRYVDDAWNALHMAERTENFEQQRDAVMKLSDIAFGENEVGQFIEALNGDTAKLAAASATPPAMLLGTLMSNVKFYGFVSDRHNPMTATIELSDPRDDS